MRKSINLILALVSVVILSLPFWGMAHVHASEEQEFYADGSQQSFKGPEKLFTGDVMVDMLFPPTDITNFSGAYVKFEAGARTAWHIHSAGQHMIVTSGVGLTQEWGGPIRVIREGDVVWCPPDVKHWHGAAYGQSMTHLVITGSTEDGNVEWLEHVSDEQYYANKGKEMPEIKVLTKKQQAMIPIATFTANGNLDALKTAVNEGLDNGLTVNEIKEIMIHIYAYAGFPRSLNALGTFMAVLDERKADNITDGIGKDATPIDNMNSLKYGEEVQTKLVGRPVTGALYTFAPAIDQYLKSHLFGDIFSCDVLTHKERELVTLSTLAGIEGAEPQLKAHYMLAANTGVTVDEMKDIVTVLDNKVGQKESKRADSSLAEMLKILEK